MTNSDLPERLRHLGGQPYNGESVVVKLNEKRCQEWEKILLPELLERERESA